MPKEPRNLVLYVASVLEEKTMKKSEIRVLTKQGAVALRARI